MILARVRGTVVADTRSDGLSAPRYLLVEVADQHGRGHHDCLVALDPIGVNRSDLVLVAQGSSCRWTSLTEDKPIETLIVARVDTIDHMGVLTYPASPEENEPDPVRSDP